MRNDIQFYNVGVYTFNHISICRISLFRTCCKSKSFESKIWSWFNFFMKGNMFKEIKNLIHYFTLVANQK